MNTLVTSKGQVTIPKKVRDHLGIKPGTAVRFEPTADGRAVLTKAEPRKTTPRKRSRFAALRGTASVRMSTEEIMALTRGDWLLVVDTNVILDVVEDDPNWADWSQTQLEAAALQYTLIINPVIYAELSIAYRRIEELESMLTTGGFRMQPIPREALFLAGKVFRQYRNRRGTKTGVLPDFFIGAHAAVAGIPLLTRDPRRYRSYFPTLEIVCPD